MAGFRAPTDEELVIRTRRLVLRPVRADDALLAFEHCSDPRVSRMMTWSPHRDPGETRTFFAECERWRRDDAGYVWAIWEEGCFRGVCGLASVTRTQAAVRVERCELGYWLGMPFHGRGLMTEAAAAATSYGFSRLAFHKVLVRAFTANAASLGVIRKLGFRPVGVLREDLCKDGVWHDHAWFEMLAGSPEAAALQSRFAPGR